MSPVTLDASAALDSYSDDSFLRRPYSSELETISSMLSTRVVPLLLIAVKKFDFIVPPRRRYDSSLSRIYRAKGNVQRSTASRHVAPRYNRRCIVSIEIWKLLFTFYFTYLNFVDLLLLRYRSFTDLTLVTIVSRLCC